MIKGYKKFFLKGLFRKVKHSSRNNLLKISPQHSIEGKFYSQMKENNITEDVEQIFHETFSNEFFNLMEMFWTATVTQIALTSRFLLIILLCL